MLMVKAVFFRIMGGYIHFFILLTNVMIVDMVANIIIVMAIKVVFLLIVTMSLYL